MENSKIGCDPLEGTTIFISILRTKSQLNQENFDSQFWNMVVIEFAKSDRARCHTCSGNIEKDAMKFGTAVSNEGYLNIQWHHSECFWTKRAGQYYRRKGKKINILLKLSQFSGQEHLNAEQLAGLKDSVNAANLKWGTAAALEKEGIEAPVKDSKKRGVEDESGVPKKKKTK